MRTNEIRLRLSDEEHATLAERAEAAQTPLARYVREAALLGGGTAHQLGTLIERLIRDALSRDARMSAATRAWLDSRDPEEDR